MSSHTIDAIVGIDFAAAGRQLGHLAVVHSDNEHDDAVIPVPIAVLSGPAEGPTVLLTAGTHGDEYEGQVLLHELIRELDPARVRGRIIVLPSLNLPAVREGRRVSAVDRANLNRALPGDAEGGPTAQIAHIIEGVLLPMADFVLDIHSGGSVNEYVPSAFVYSGPTETDWSRKVAAVEAFGQPYCVIVSPDFVSGSISGAADRAGVTMISTELAGRGTINRRVLTDARAGLYRLLAHVGVIAPPSGTDDAGPHRGIDPEADAVAGPGITYLELGPRSAVMARAAGLFEPSVDLGQPVAVGDLIGRIHFIEELGRPWQEYHAHMDGLVGTLRHPTLVQTGTTLVNIVVPLESSSRLES
ncbi:succinylglutamate desuccinylase/aspartoacylase family protein [Arthrobacter sp. SDTb3-6]|uniref:succinylglutamate desuccinylase/aspartoacylase family protein n=1 Tax=Arthrobacter sp. SDTb3-6 TaxID=2713571 RepID=UPI00159DC086|nr:succinylglutamate desuccinylase/aspartoacylase family protein [Arthrobacter sp. SDTb3-6]NVM99042.1 succinylglutamate desuccinylase [Arthrobacter sp. SDTb3-6]